MKYTPKDNDYYRELFESKGRGSCGISVLAVLTKSPCKSILEQWRLYLGYASFKDMMIMLEKFGYEFKIRRGNKSKNINLPEGTRAICRVQFLGENGPYHGYKSWHEATRNTHYILIENDQVFCNAEGWFDKILLPNYLKDGYITSYLEIE